MTAVLTLSVKISMGRTNVLVNLDILEMDKLVPVRFYSHSSFSKRVENWGKFYLAVACGTVTGYQTKDKKLLLSPQGTAR